MTGRPRALLTGIGMLLIGLMWAGWLMFVEIVSISGTPGGMNGDHTPIFGAPLALAVAGIIVMIASRFIKEDP